jgi:2-polyprenyl-3-methyl-5-hydroxy-6-metoxy-1,4-benzoquinol methylase
MREINQKVLAEQETSWEEFITKNKHFFEQFKNEQYLSNLKQEIKAQALGNKDKTFKKEILEKWQDDRLNQIPTEWLHGKKVMDVGCSTGLLDLLMAVKHQPKLIIALDIDHQLIKTAIDNM